MDSSARVLVPPSGLQDFVSSLELNKIDYEEFISDVEETIDDEREALAHFADNDPDEISFKKYYRHDEINDILDGLARRYPRRAQVETPGQSYEGRNMNILRIRPKSNASHPVTIFVDAAIHAREWIAPATALYAIQQLLEPQKVRKYDELLNDIEWIFLPVVNPDGYEYSHKKDRFWRKTRRRAGMCVGVDGNRNFAHEWGTQGASKSSCAQTYRGDEVFSEPETRVVRDIMESLKGKCKMYLTLHSYGKYLLYPFGHTSELPENWKELDDVARAGADAIRKYSGGATKYKIGSTRNVLYAASGSSTDYAFSTHKIPISLTMELPGGGYGGFDPPPSSIEASVKESWEGIRSMAIRIAEKFVTHYHYDYDEYDSDQFE